MLEKSKKHSGNIFKYLLFILFAIGFYACEFESDDFNYVHLEKPEDQIQLGIDLAGVNPHEIIYVYNNSVFSYSLFTDGKDILVRQFFLDGIPIETNEYSGEAYLNTNIKDNDIHELKLVIALRTGTGSLAEHAQYEMFTGEFNFKLKIIEFSENLNIKEAIDSNNNLKLEWDKPENFDVSGYSIYKGDSMHGELLAKINNPNQTYFVDTDYAYGYKTYTIVAEIKNSFNLSVKDDISVSYINMTEKDFDFQRISVDEFSVKWKNPNPFPCKYVVNRNDFTSDEIIIEEGLSEVVLSVSEFPWRESFTLYIVPITADINRYKYYSSVNVSYKDENFSGISFTSNLKSNLLHRLTFPSLISHDISTMKEVANIPHNLTLHTGCQVKTSTDGMVAMEDINGSIHFYSDYSLKNKLNQFQADSYPFQLISKNRFLSEERSGFKIYDVVTKDVVCSKLWVSDLKNGEVVTKTTASSDGKYVYVQCRDYYWANSTKEWVELYEIETDNSLKLLETLHETNIESIRFHPTRNHEAIFQYASHKENKFVITDILTKNKKEISGEFMNIDPFTSNLLFRGERYQEHEYNVHVWDKNYSKEIIKIKLSDINSWSYSTLYNNKLFFNGHYVDLSNLKEWNQ